MFTLRVLSYNIRGLPIPFFVDHSRYRRIGEILRRRREAGDAPQVVALQEAFHSRIFDLIDAAGYPHLAFGPEAKGLKLRSGLALLSEFPIVDSDHWVFTKNIRWDRFVRKAIQYAQIHVPGVQSPIDVFNLHLASPDTDFNAGVKPREAIYARSWQVREVSRLVRKRSAPDRICLIPGDFNFRPHDSDASWMMRRLSVLHSGSAILNLGDCSDAETIHHDLKHSDDHQFFRSEQGRVRIKPVRLRRTFSDGDERRLSDHTGLEVDYVLEDMNR